MISDCNLSAPTLTHMSHESFRLDRSRPLDGYALHHVRNAGV